MRGLKKVDMKLDMDIATLWKNRPRGRFFDNHYRNPTMKLSKSWQPNLTNTGHTLTMSSSADISADIVKFIMFLLLGVLLVIMATVVALVYIAYTEGELFKEPFGRKYCPDDNNSNDENGLDGDESKEDHLCIGG